MSRPKLYIDMIPSTSWFKNLRSILNQKEWKDLKIQVYSKYNFKCSICQGIGHKWPVEAHERWEYIGNNQILIDIVALCPKCHLSTHIGFAQVLNKEKEALLHLKKINEFTDYELQLEYYRGFSEYFKRSNVNWNLDLTYLIENFNISEKTKNKIKEYIKYN